ncbi:tail protein (putative endopeptidase) [Breznakibacter xylanolyticus]|uniref:Tail protein (Putative endopeptidase) n=1 Tax=Breznakibacter xylanolyticus TaxID=990 RepID=A0A2W7NCG0_9BACT|nr:hypothetical protein [Breznakibacter xylanolyticus]PZX18115.1 tail protein (putative endopeptidase) [Breznakibacter xylanolyticus]
MNINIYRAGSVVTTLPVADNAECKRNMQGVDEITMEVVQTTGSMPVQIGDYIIFENRNYYLNQPATLEKRSEVEYQFRLVFEANIYTLLNKLFQQPVTGRGDFALVDDLNGFVDVLLENINGIDSGWTKGSIPTTERKLMTFDGETCRAVMNRLADDFDVEFVVIGKQIAFYDIYETATSLVFEHGKGKGLYQLTRENVDSDNTVTRGWFWGSTKNIDYTYRNGETRLMFTNPATGTNRIDNFGEFAKVVEKQVIFEDVWPHFTGTIATVSNNTTTRTHSFTCPQIDFDVELQLMEGITGKVFFKSGDLQSQEFEIKSYDHATRTITLITYTDEFGGVWPNASFMPRVGDQFTFIDIMMPSAYVAAAEAELAAKAADWMAYYSKLRVKYRLDLDPRYLRNNAITLNLGDVVRIIDSALGIDRQIRITSIEKDIANPYRVKCEISNILEERWDKKISKKVQEAINTAKSATEKSSSIAGSAASAFFRQYFEIKGTAGVERIEPKLTFRGQLHAPTSIAYPGIAISNDSGTVLSRLYRSNTNGVWYIDGNQIMTGANILNALLTGYVVGTDVAVVASDTILAAIQKIQGQINNRPKYNENATITGAWTFNQCVTIPVNGGKFLQGGDDVGLYDVNVPNTLGVYGEQNQTVGAIQLGSQGVSIMGDAGNLLVGGGIGIAKTNSNSPVGISLWDGYSNVNGIINYGMFFANTNVLGGHGHIPTASDKHATYLTMNNDGTAWGWIFANRANGQNVASLTTDGRLVTKNTITAGDGASGVVLNNSGGIEIYHASTPYIDFHYGNNAGDFTSRIIESGLGQIDFLHKSRFQNNLSSISYSSGFAGMGWQLEYGNTAQATLTVDNLYVRGSMNVYELVVNQVRATNGSLWVSDSCKAIYVKSGSFYDFTFDDDGGRSPRPFREGDIVQCQVFDGKNVKKLVGIVKDLSGYANSGFGLQKPLLEGDSQLVAGQVYDFVRISSVSDTNRQGALYLTSSDQSAPFMDVIDGDYTTINAPNKIRYIRDWMCGNSIDGGNHWIEIQAIDYNGVNQAYQKPAWGSNTLTNPSNLTNNSLNWEACGTQSLGGDEYVVVDLQVEYDIEKVKVWHYYYDNRTYHHTKTEVSADGVNWYCIHNYIIHGEYVETYDGRTYVLGNKRTKARLGQLSGIVDANYGQLSGFGLYAENAYLTGGIVAKYGRIANFTIKDDWMLGGDESFLNNISNGQGVAIGKESYNDFPGMYAAWNNGAGVYGNVSMGKILRHGVAWDSKIGFNFFHNNQTLFEISKNTSSGEIIALIAGFNFSATRLWAGADWGAGAGLGLYNEGNYKMFHAYKDTSNYVRMGYGIDGDSDWGLNGVVSGSSVFKLGLTNQIAGFTFTNNKLSSNVFEITSNTDNSWISFFQSSAKYESSSGIKFFRDGEQVATIATGGGNTGRKWVRFGNNNSGISVDTSDSTLKKQVELYGAVKINGAMMVGYADPTITTTSYTLGVDYLKFSIIDVKCTNYDSKISLPQSGDIYDYFGTVSSGKGTIITLRNHHESTCNPYFYWFYDNNGTWINFSNAQQVGKGDSMTFVWDGSYWLLINRQH